MPNDEDPILDSSVSCTSTPSELLIPELYLQNERQPAVENVIECHVSSSQSSRTSIKTQSCRSFIVGLDKSNHVLASVQ